MAEVRREKEAGNEACGAGIETVSVATAFGEDAALAYGKKGAAWAFGEEKGVASLKSVASVKSVASTCGKDGRMSPWVGKARRA